MGLLDQLKTADDGVQAPKMPGVTWRPAKDRKHPEGIEGTITEVRRVPVREPKDGGPTHDFVVLVDSGNDEPWRVYGSTRDLRDKFDALNADGLLVEGKQIAVKFLGERKEKAKDGTAYTCHTYAVAVA
jgi:hypothetical protein